MAQRRVGKTDDKIGGNYEIKQNVKESNGGKVVGAEINIITHYPRQDNSEINNQSDNSLTSKMEKSNEAKVDSIEEKTPQDSILVIGSAYKEHTIYLDKELYMGQKQRANINHYIGGSGINYSLRLLGAGIATIPIVPLGNDTNGNYLRSKILKKAAFSKKLERIIDTVLASDLEATPHSYILIEGKNERRTIFGERVDGFRLFKKHIENQIDFLCENKDLNIKCVTIGHIPEMVDEADNSEYPNTTRYIINKFKDKCLVYTNFGESQIKLGFKYWEKDLENVDIFQLNLGEARRFFKDEKGIPSLVDIIKWFQKRDKTAVITLDKFGAIGTYKKGREGIILIWPFDIPDYIDSTGAGDAMGAGLVSSLYREYDCNRNPKFIFDDFVAALRIARIWAAHACTTLGGFPKGFDINKLNSFSEILLDKCEPGVEVNSPLSKAEPTLKLIDSAYSGL